MNYIVLDLEWNQAAYKVDEEVDIPFEIIEIGAVKLDSNCEKLDEFQELIRPQVYPFLLRRTREITGWTDEDLDTKGIYFEEACDKFLKWCGKDFVFCIWGPTDLTQLERNMKYYGIKIPWKFPFKYLDVQKLYALQEKEGKVRHTLEFVIDRYGIESDRPFHHAVDDAAYTGMVLQRINRKELEAYFSVDYFRIPKNRFEETTFYFKTYSKFVSRGYALKEEVTENRRLKETPCLYCKRNMKRIVPWFSDGGRSYIMLAECKEHGKMRGRIRVKACENYMGYFGVRTIKVCSPEDEGHILMKKEALKKKRKERRKRGSGGEVEEA